MQTKLSAFCDALIEAGWLLAVILVPLFFNVYSSRVFEPDKLSLLRTIALVMALAWLIKQGELHLGSRRNDSEPDRKPGAPWWRVPLVAPVLLLALVYLLSTATSIVPRTSFWGSYQRLQGTYTVLCYLVIFFLMINHLKHARQLQRLWVVIILTSVPITLYGLVQHYQMDPLPWGGDVTFRVAANMGNAIFIGAYLIMVIPVTLARVVYLQSEILKDESRKNKWLFGLAFWVLLVVVVYAMTSLGFARGLAVAGLFLIMLVLAARLLGKPIASLVLPGIYGLVLCFQLVCLVFSQSRGPMLGALAGAFFLVLLYLFVRHWRRAILALVVVAILGSGLLVVMNVPNSPLAAVRDVPYLGRLGRLLETSSGTGRVRLLIWEGVLRLLAANPVRAIIGYGPEAMYVAYNPYYPPELAQLEARNASPDRSHNETYDSLVRSGAIGLIAYLALFGSLFLYGLQCLGMVHGPRDRWLYALLGLGGATLGVVVPWLLDGSLRFAGVGLPLGLVAGVAVYVMISALLRRGTKSEVAEADAVATPVRSQLSLWLIVAIVSALIAHFVEINFGIAVASTCTYFWVYAGLLVVLGQGKLEGLSDAGADVEIVTPVVPEADRRTRGNRRRRRAVAVVEQRPAANSMAWESTIAALLCAVIVITMVWDYTTNPQAELNPIAVLMTSLTTLAARKHPEIISLGMLWLFVASAILCALALMHDLRSNDEPDRKQEWWLTTWGRFLLVAGAPTLVYALVHASRIGPRAAVSSLFPEYCIVLALLWAALAWTLYKRGPRPSQWSRTGLGMGLAYLFALGLVLVIGYNTNLSPVRADVLYKQGLRYDQESSWSNAATLYKRAVDAAPNEDFYRLFYGRVLMEEAKQATDTKMRDAYFEEALDTLQRARQLNPLNTDHTANIARLYRTWGEMETDANLRAQRYRLSAEFYQEALALSPNSAQLHNEAGLVLFLSGDLDGAMQRYQESMAMDDRYPQTYLLMGDVYLSKQDWQAAAEVYRRVVELDENAIQGWSALGYALSQSQDWEGAIAANLKVLEVVQEDYSTYKNLAILYNQVGDPTTALSYARLALAQAPDNEKTVLENYIAQLEGGAQEGGQ